MNRDQSNHIIVSIKAVSYVTDRLTAQHRIFRPADPLSVGIPDQPNTLNMHKSWTIWAFCVIIPT